MELISLKIPETVGVVAFNSLLSLVGEEKKMRIMKFCKERDRYRTLLGDVLIRQFIMSTRNIDNREIEFSTNRHNKPYLKNDDTLYFNISHSGNWVILAVDSKEIGVDIELMRTIDYAVIKVIFSEDEIEYFQKLPEGQKQPAFYKIWTYKESFTKASGEGLAKNLKKYSTIPAKNDSIISISDGTTLYYLKQYYDIPDYKLSVCALHGNFSASPQCKTFETLYNEIMVLRG